MRINRFLIGTGAVLFIVLSFFPGCVEHCTVGCFDEQENYSLTSEFTGFEYELSVLYPSDFDSSKFYHTVYLSDANWHFEETAEVVRNEFSNVVLIGISYKKGNSRVTDMTFPEDEDYASESGGGDKYAKFITRELIPFVSEKLFVKASDMTLAGHSLGGYFALYMLFQQEIKNPFDNIVAASPSMWWNDAYIFELEKAYGDGSEGADRKLFISMGELEGVSMVATCQAFEERIKQRNYSGLQFEFLYLGNTSHSDTSVRSFRYAFDKLFH